MNQLFAEISFRKGNDGDLPEIKTLFIETIVEICKSDYNSQQIDAWIFETKNNENSTRWEALIIEQYVWLAIQKNKIVGFITLKSGNYIDFLFVHKDYQRMGIASKLFHHIENEAKRQRKKKLTAHVSKTAKVFFEKQQFKVISTQFATRKGVQLMNYRMTKAIAL